MHSAGTISEGWDYAGMFHWGEDLAGHSFEQSITVDTAMLDDNHLGPGFNMAGGVSQPGSVVYGKTSVGGENYTWRLDGQEAHVYLVNYLHMGYPNSPDQAGILAQGTNALNGQFVGALINTQSETNSFINDTNFAQNLNLTGLPGVSTYVMFMDNQLDGTQTFFGGHATSTTWEVSAVPEPDSVAMLLAGAGVIALAARRRSRVNAGAAGAPRLD